jgi:hypothetical protein
MASGPTILAGAIEGVAHRSAERSRTDIMCIAVWRRQTVRAKSLGDRHLIRALVVNVGGGPTR